MISIAFSTGVKSQFYNNGATITIQNGGYIMLAGDFENISGTIVNDGKIEVQGNFINYGSYTSSTNEDSLIMTGAGNNTLLMSGSVINYLIINKASGSDMVILGGEVIINTKLDCLSGLFSTDPILNPSYTVTSPINAVYNFASGEEIIGAVKRTGWTNGVTGVFNQPNMLVTTAGGTAPATFTVTMIPQSAGSDPTQAEREVKRKFLFAQSGGGGFNSEIRFPYLAGELNSNLESNIIPWELKSAEWNARFTQITRDITNHYVIASGIPEPDLALEWKLADPKYNFNIIAFLRGAWASGPNMTTQLNSALPVIQPYNDAAFNFYNGGETVPAGFFALHPNIVDWVLIDFRKPFTNLPADAISSTSVGRKAAFLLNNGTIADLDGVSPLSFDISKQGGGFIVIHHRNHLAVMSNLIPSNTIGFYSNDFSLLAGAYRNSLISIDPEQLLPGSDKYGLWAGNSNKDETVNASDIALVKANANAALNGYVLGDVNLDQTVNSSDVALTKVSANNTAQSSINYFNIQPRSHVPAEKLH